jgi:hypothetical protein
MGNHPIIIARFEKMLESKSKFNDYTLLTVAEGLKQIDRENQKASQTLVEMLDSKDKTLCILASNILGKLEIEEDDAIRALENKIESTDNSNIKVKVKLIYNLSVLIPNHDLVNSTIETINFNDLTEEEILTVAYDLFKIKEEKNILFNKLLELTFAKDRPKKLKNICFYLQRMITRENAKKIIHSYRDYCSNQFLSKNCKNSHEIDTLLWHCAQHMSYPEFYQAWHEPNTTQKQLENSYNDLTEILKQLQPNDKKSPLKIDDQFHVQVILIDNSNFTNPDNPALDIYIQMVQQNCPKCSESRPKTMQELKAYWQLDVNINDKPLFLLFYPKANNGELQGWSDRFLQDLDKFGGNIGIIVSEPINFSNLRSFFADDPQLIENILGWMRSIILEQ